MVGVFPACIFSYRFFNKWDDRAADVTPFRYLFPQERIFSAFHCFSLATVPCYLPGKMLSLKEEASANF